MHEIKIHRSLLISLIFNKMHYYSSLLLLITMFSLLIILSSTTTMASPYDNYYPYFPPYNYPPISFQTPPPPPSSSPGNINYDPPPPDTYNQASPPPPSNGNVNDDDKTQFLKEHNEARHNITDAELPALVWNEALADYALKYANQRKDCKMVHSGGQYGENIAAGSGDDFSAKEAVDLWVEEKDNYKYSTNTCPGGDHVCGHYTQVIWRKTTDLGCARVRCNYNGNDDWFFVICSYSPAGNVAGEKPY